MGNISISKQAGDHKGPPSHSQPPSPLRLRRAVPHKSAPESPPINDYVIFINQSSPAATYSVAAENGSFSSPAIAPSKQWATAFNTQGTYEYHTASSPQHMIGEIIVVPNSVSLLPTPAPETQATAIAIIATGFTPTQKP